MVCMIMYIFAVEISYALHKEVEVARIEPVDIDCCIYCKSTWIVKDGLRHNKYAYTEVQL